VWLAAGCCTVNPSSGPPAAWFTEEAAAAASSSSQGSGFTEPWKLSILKVINDDDIY